MRRDLFDTRKNQQKHRHVTSFFFCFTENKMRKQFVRVDAIVIVAGVGLSTAWDEKEVVFAVLFCSTFFDTSSYPLQNLSQPSKQSACSLSANHNDTIIHYVSSNRIRRNNDPKAVLETR